MEAEFIAVSGPLLGARFSLGEAGVRIGRAPGSEIAINDSGAAWEHCVVRARDGRFHIQDRHTGAGTYVNGMRITEHCLEAGDQVSIGDTVLVYREDPVVLPADSPQHTLLRACSLLFLFRALASAHNEVPRRRLGDQILRLLADLTPCRGGTVALGHDEEELRASAGDLANVAARVLREGAVVDAERGIAAVALYVQGTVAGMIAAEFPAEEAVNLADHRDTLSAVATLAAAALENVREVERLQAENALLRGCDTGIVGEGPSIRKVNEMIARLAPQDASVLILGESGTGKELVARALHAQSPRAPKPFVAINCAALTDTLLESELFGHEKGSFTGAVAQKKGKLELAERGTAFLDEIGELAPALQAKLLRVLQQREFERVGGTKTLKLDVRIVAATNRDLAAEVQRGRFREDLYHRLNVVALRVPPLRDRAEDIPVLIQFFLERAAARCRRRVTGVSPDAERYLRGYSWPGNVRELENAIERAVVLGQADTIQPEDLPESVLDWAPAPDAGGLQSSVVERKRQAIVAAWREAGGDHNQTAARLNIHPNSLRRLIRSLNLRSVLE